MIRQNTWHAVFLLALVAGACSPVHDGIAVTVADSAGTSLVTLRGPLERLPAFRLDTEAMTILDSPDSAGYSLVTGAGVVGSNYFVTDSRAFRIHIYDSTGGYHRSLGGQGSGPGEIQNVQTTSSLDEAVYVWDLSLRRFSMFNADSGLMRSTSLPRRASSTEIPREAWGAGRGGFLVLWLRPLPAEAPPQGSVVVRREQPGGLVMYDSAGTEVSRSPAFTAWVSGQTELGELRLPVSNTPFVAVGNERIAYGSGEEFLITVSSHDLRDEVRVRWVGLDSALTQEEIEAALSARREAMPPGADAATVEATLRLMFDKAALPPKRPAISRAFWDSSGFLWLGLFHTPSRNAPEAYDWVVLSPELRPVGMLRLPLSVRLEAVRGDNALVTVKDQLDVQSVQLRRLYR